MSWQQRTPKSKPPHIRSMNHILRGVNPGCGLPSNQDPKGTNATSEICVSLHLSFSNTFHPSTQRKSSSISWIQCISIALFSLVKYFPSNNLVTRSYGKICGCYFLFAASETHYVWLKMDIVGIPLPVNETSQQRRVLQTQWVIFIPKPVSKYCHALFKERGVCTATWDLIIINPNWFENE